MTSKSNVSLLHLLLAILSNTYTYSYIMSHTHTQRIQW